MPTNNQPWEIPSWITSATHVSSPYYSRSEALFNRIYFKAYRGFKYVVDGDDKVTHLKLAGLINLDPNEEFEAKEEYLFNSCSPEFSWRYSEIKRNFLDVWLSKCILKQDKPNQDGPFGELFKLKLTKSGYFLPRTCQKLSNDFELFKDRLDDPEIKNEIGAEADAIYKRLSDIFNKSDLVTIKGVF